MSDNRKYKIIGFSGSPIRNSNTDRLLKHTLENTGLAYQIVKLSNVNIGPCRACKGCVSDNICKVKDDFPAIAEKIKEADAIVLGAYTPYSLIDGFTKALLERFFSMRHQRSVLKGKYLVSIVASTYHEVRQQAHNAIILESIAEKMRYVSSLDISGSNPCFSCGSGNNCENSIKKRMGADADLSVDAIIPVESQAVWQQAELTGRQLARLIKGDEEYEAGVEVVEIKNLLKKRYFDRKRQIQVSQQQ